MKVRAAHNFYPGFPRIAEEFDVKPDSTVFEFLKMLSDKYEYDFIGNKISIRFLYPNSSTKTIENLNIKMTDITSDGSGRFYIWITPNKLEATINKHYVSPSNP
jgi:hypothetical protein